jgi:hypothetical protein
MPIVLWPPSVKQREVFEAGLRDLVALHRIPEGLIVDPNPLPVYSFELRDVLARAELADRGKLVSWRYYATGGAPATVVSGDVTTTSTPQLTTLSYGPAVVEAMNTAKDIQKRRGAEVPSYEPRLLRIPGLLVEAHWVKPLVQPAGGKATGWVLPYNTPHGHLRAKEFTEEDFSAEISPLAEKVLGMTDSPHKVLLKDDGPKDGEAQKRGAKKVAAAPKGKTAGRK